MKSSRDDNSELEALGEKIRQAQQLQDEKNKPPADDNVSAASVWRISSDLLGGVAVGAGMGLTLDHFLGTSPWLFLLCFFLGTAAGFMMIYRATAFDGRNNKE